MSASLEITTSRERLSAAMNHTQPDRIPIDFGGTAVTGVHASCVAALRDLDGLEKRPVRIHEVSIRVGLEHFRNTRRLFESIERWLFLEEKPT